MNGRVGIYDKWPKTSREVSSAIGRVTDRLIARHKKWLKSRAIVLDCTVWEMTGCTTETFYRHFNSLFEGGMTWLNYSEWQIDHIFPLAAIEQSDISSILGAFNYQNLRPMWALDNSKKGTSVICPRPIVSHLSRGHPDSEQNVHFNDLDIISNM
jgi:hypothetical protein